MMNVKGYGKLTEEQKDLFDQTYKKHMGSMGTSEKAKYTEDKIKKVNWDNAEKCLKVYFENDWYHYKNGRWY